MILYLFTFLLGASAQQAAPAAQPPSPQTPPVPVATPVLANTVSEMEIRRSRKILEDEGRLEVLEEIPAPVQKVDLKRIQEKVLAEEDQE